MRMLVLNGAFAIFSLIWLIGHATVRMFDREFWFALAFLVFTVLNLVHFVRRIRPVHD